MPPACGKFSLGIIGDWGVGILDFGFWILDWGHGELGIGNWESGIGKKLLFFTSSSPLLPCPPTPYSPAPSALTLQTS
jgi:hypothetical protein